MGGNQLLVADEDIVSSGSAAGEAGGGGWHGEQLAAVDSGLVSTEEQERCTLVLRSRLKLDLRILLGIFL